MGDSKTVVLVTDDEDDIRMICGMNLELEGFGVSEATNGEEALRLARTSRPHLILLDLMMPVKDGWETLEALMEDDDLRTIPVVILTGKVQSADQLQAYRAGAVDYITKPFHPDALAEKVRNVLASSTDELEQQRTAAIRRLEALQKP